MRRWVGSFSSQKDVRYTVLELSKLASYRTMRGGKVGYQKDAWAGMDVVRQTTQIQTSIIDSRGGELS